MKRILYLDDTTVFLDLPFILTCDKFITIGTTYLKLEGQHIDTIKLIDVWDEEDIAYLKVQDLKTGRIYIISWNMNYTGEYWLWSIASTDYLTKEVNLEKGM